jgi:hypothetical protein
MAPRRKSVAKEINTYDMEVGQPAPIILKDGTLATNPTIDPIKGDVNDDYVKTLAFMEEPMEIILLESSDPNAPNPVIVGNNGMFQTFFRGVPTKTKRKFVDCLIVKSGRVTTPKVRNGAGEDAYAIHQHSAHAYPFTVVSDQNPMGAEWIKRRMADII